MDDKGKSTAASSQGIGASSGKGPCEIQSDSDDERGEQAAGRAPRVADERAGSSTAGAGGGGASSSSAPSATQAIGPFEDGQYVRLRNRGRGGYLFALENGRGVSVDRHRGMVNTAWAVQIVRTDHTARIRLRSAYSRYLCTTIRPAGFGLIGCYATQAIFEYSPDPEIEWAVTMGKRGSVVLVQETDAGMGALRANGRYQRWNTDVTFGPVNLVNHVSSMMEWEVQVIPLTLEAPPYHPRPPNDASRRPKGCEEVVHIIYSRAWFGDNGSVEREQWIHMRFRGRRLPRLRHEIAHRLGVQPDKITLFAQAGDLAQPIPLLTDLHLRDDQFLILAFMVDSPGYNALRFPDLAAE